jgi:hypothetical protein
MLFWINVVVVQALVLIAVVVLIRRMRGQRGP